MNNNLSSTVRRVPLVPPPGGAGAFCLQPFGSGDKGRDKPTQRRAAIEQTPQSSGRLRQEIPLLYLLRRCRSASSNYNLFPIMSNIKGYKGKGIKEDQKTLDNYLT